MLLRGVGLGNWLLPEGYMWKFGKGAESPREIESLVERLIGASSAEAFWTRFREAFISEADIQRIAESGFDHVRLPINSRVVQTADGEPIEAGYALIDRVVEWCRRHRLWVLLDLHGAPGGQTGTNIDDSPRGKPELFMEERYRRNTVRLWRDLASRYAADTTVLGYDLLNEPLPNEWQDVYAVELIDLYRDLTAEIRSVDPHHLIVYEGSHWATNWQIFTEVWDENSLLQFHKYWSSPDEASISTFLETRERLGLPIYMGEGGENTLEWIYTATRLYETHDIGWNFWPWKKLDTRTSPLSVVPPVRWPEVIGSIGGEARLSTADAVVVFDELLEAMRVENCVWQPDLVAALTAESPSVLPAWGFGFRGEGESYATSAARPMEGIRWQEAVTLRFAVDGASPENPFGQSDGRAYARDELLVAELERGDWLEFELDPATDARAAEALGPGGEPAAMELTRTERGLRATATRPTTFARIVLRGRGSD
ncbi:hypothetical protein GCM10022239_12180 [Leifsonia bigeumensis]|uniref:Exo-1,3-beta-glucanase D n=1 Tax=Leifsonella bigeumensis TaxID=433643 RepID=A0ABP7FFH2_9MICO